MCPKVGVPTNALLCAEDWVYEEVTEYSVQRYGGKVTNSKELPYISRACEGISGYLHPSSGTVHRIIVQDQNLDHRCFVLHVARSECT